MESIEVDAVGGLSPKSLWDGLRTDWLIVDSPASADKGYVHARWVEQVRDRRHQLTKQTQRTKQSGRNGSNSSPTVLIAEPDPQRFLACLWAALLERWTVALANPHWGVQEWRSTSQQIQPIVIWGASAPVEMFSAEGCLSTNVRILIPTGGTSGDIKFVPHTWETLLAAVSGFRRYFAPDARINSYCVLPLYHVSGLMQVLRSVASSGQVAIASFKQLEQRIESTAADLPFSPASDSSRSGSLRSDSLRSDSSFNQSDRTNERQTFHALSLVPTQLHRLLSSHQNNQASCTVRHSSQWLRQFHAVFLGGAPPWPGLLDAAQAQRIPLSLTYGMTETAAMVSAMKPAAFLSGDRSSGARLPHAALEIVRDGHEGQPLEPNQTGTIVIHARSIPAHLSGNQTLVTSDLGYLSAEGRLCVVGRASQMIISGGENIAPTEVEAAIHSTGKVKDVCVFGLADPLWGEAVAAAYVPSDDLKEADSATATHALKTSLSQARTYQGTPLLSRYKHPKYWIALTALPRNAQGKINHQALIAQAQLKPQSNPSAQPVAPSDGGCWC